MSRYLVHSTPQSHRQHHSRQVMHRPRHRYEHPLMYYIPMDSRRRRPLGRTRPSTQNFSYSKMVADMLKLHNYHRARHCAQPLTINQQLNQIAQSYAEELAATSRFEHSGNKLGDKALGENLYMEWISHGRVTPSVKNAMKSWYDEISLHDFQRPTYSPETGHFTQMVWKSTRKMGAGVAFSPDGREVYFVTNYYPAGNIVSPGYFERNVLPPRC